MTLQVRTRPFDLAAGLLDHLPDDVAPYAWLSGQGATSQGWVGWGEAARIDAGTGVDRFDRADAAWRDLASSAVVDDPLSLPGSGLVAFGSFTFRAGSPGSTLVVPEVVVGRSATTAWITQVTVGSGAPPSPPDPALLPGLAAAQSAGRQPDRPRYAGSSLPDHHWLDAVATAVERIRGSDLDKVVLARDHAVWARDPFDPRVLARRLHARFPACFTFVGDGLVGATPELLVRRSNGQVASFALAGSAARGPDADSDRRAGEQLLASPKDRWEHQLAAASVRNVLQPRCTTWSETGPELLRLDNVQHLATRFEGELADAAPPSSLELAGALHPTAAVGGAPTAPAIALIAELEQMDRGRYAGPVGWIGANGDGEWGIALRCAELSGARARLFAGAGIVAGSLPEAELEETRLKLRAMQSAFEP